MCVFGNCQCSGIKYFLKFSKFYDYYDAYSYANWELLNQPDLLPIEMIKKADLIIYQPLSDVHGCYSTNIRNENSFMKLIKPECKILSFPRIHNNSLFPLFRKASNKPDYYGKVNNSFTTRKELLDLYNQNQLDFDLENRMNQNILISREKEKDCDVKIIDFILEHIKTHKLFLTQDHPTSFIFNEITRQICHMLDLEYDYEKGILEDENIVGLPDSVYTHSSKQYPISRYSMNYFQFEYICEEDTNANDFYLQQLLTFYKL